MSEQEKFSIDGMEYNVADLSEEGKAIWKSLRFVEYEIAQIEARLSVMNTAKTAYLAAIQKELPIVTN